MKSEVLFIIPTFLRTNEEAKVLAKCVGTLRDTTDQKILLVDDGSPVKNKDNFFKELKDWVENVDTFLKEQNEGFSKTVNIGLQRALRDKTDACLVNADIEFFRKEWLEELQQTEGDIIGAKLLYPNLVIQHGGIYWSRFLRTFDHRFRGSPPNLPASDIQLDCPVTGALQYIRLPVLEKIGLYDEGFPLGFEDVDYCIRAVDAGFKCVYNPKVRALHHESLFRGNKNDGEHLTGREGESWVYFIKKYADKNFSGIFPGEVR